MLAARVLLTVVLAITVVPAHADEHAPWVSISDAGGAARIYEGIQRGRDIEHRRQRLRELERREDERYELERRARQRAAERGEVQPAVAPSAAPAHLTAETASGSCLLDSVGRPACAPSRGGIGKDSVGNVVCGIGQCVADDVGRVLCSAVLGGGAILDSLGTPRCVGGCEQAQARHCAVPR